MDLAHARSSFCPSARLRNAGQGKKQTAVIVVPPSHSATSRQSDGRTNCACGQSPEEDLRVLSQSKEDISTLRKPLIQRAFIATAATIWVSTQMFCPPIAVGVTVDPPILSIQQDSSLISDLQRRPGSLSQQPSESDMLHAPALLDSLPTTAVANASNAYADLSDQSEQIAENKPSEVSVTQASETLTASDAKSGPSTPIVSTECSNSSNTLTEQEERQESEEVTDLSVVLEAWDVVNEAFLDARNKGWNADAWLARKEAILKRPPHSRPEAYSMISTMLVTLNDPYSRFVSPQQFAMLAKYDITGIGLNIGEDVEGGSSRLKVVGIILGSPAQVAGVRQGDELVAVNGEEVRGMTPFDVASMIQGTKGIAVSISVRHDGCAPVQSFTLQRTSDVKSPVFYRLEKQRPSLGFLQEPEGDKSEQLTGYIRVKEFNAVAKRDVVTAIKRLQAAGATSYVLDLQDNPGGLVQAGVEISKLFLERGDTVVYTEARGPASQRSIEASGSPLTDAPLTVLVNGRTASASEIVAGALHDNCRALLVGSRTFGKGLIQTVYELNDGSGLILTVGKYVTPSHVDIDTNGIQPDFRRPPSDELREWKLQTCKQQLEKATGGV